MDITLSASSGLTVTARLYRGGVAVGADFPMQEISGIGEYFCSMPANTLAGKYLIVFFSGGQKLTSTVIFWDGQAEFYPIENKILNTNIVQVNGVAVSGTGQPGNEWGPA